MHQGPGVLNGRLIVATRSAAFYSDDGRYVDITHIHTRINKIASCGII